MLSSLNAPISGLVNVLQGTIRNAVYVLEAVSANKKKSPRRNPLNAFTATGSCIKN
jgi:hypothetical protein